LQGYILSISETSILLHSKEDFWGLELTLQFQLPTEKSFLTQIQTKAILSNKAK